MDSKVCFGCGEVLQTIDEKQKGYVLERILISEQTPLCQRCFKLKHYNQNIDIDDKFEFNLDYQINQGSLVVYLIDILNLQSGLKKIDSLNIKKNKLIILVNFSDCFDFFEENILLFLQNQYKKYHFYVEDTIFISGKNNLNIDKAIEAIEKNRHNSDIYIVGATSVGKSTFINSLLKTFNLDEKHLLTVSPYLNTTLKNIPIPIDEKSFLYDTPGFTSDGDIKNYLSPQLIKTITPKNKIRPKVYQLKGNQSLIISNIVVISFAKPCNVTCYISNDISIVRVKTEVLESSFRQMIKHRQLGIMQEEIHNLEQLKSTKLKAIKNMKNHLTILGLGFLSFNSDEQTIEAYSLKNSKIEIVEGFI